MANLKRNKIYVKESEVHGHGVFAEVEIAPGELIEECLTLLTLGKACPLLFDYCFKATIKSLNEYSIIPLGYGCIYNHSNTPNANHMIDPESRNLVVTANRRIKPGEEIFISYGKNYFDKRDMPIKQLTLKYKIKNLFFRESILRRMILVTAAITLFTLYVSS